MEPVAKAIEAKVVNDTNGLFDIDSPLKDLTFEELLTKCIDVIKTNCIEYPTSIEILEIKKFSLKIKKSKWLKDLYIYVSELYRRNALDYTDNALFLSGNWDSTVNSNLYKRNNVKIFLYNCKEIFFGESCFLCKKEVIKGFYLTPIFCVKHINVYEFFGNENNVMCYSCKSKYKPVRNESPEPIAIKTNLLPPDNTELLVRCVPINESLFYERFREIYNNMTTTIRYLNYYFENKLQDIQMVKDTMQKILKTPLLTNDLESCMDEILDLNGNKISQMKDYLTEEQYRFVRSGAKFEQLDGQQDMLSRMNKMLDDLKRYAIGEAVLSPIHNLEKEFTSYKIRQLNHEKDLEKLLKNTKI